VAFLLLTLAKIANAQISTKEILDASQCGDLTCINNLAAKHNYKFDKVNRYFPAGEPKETFFMYAAPSVATNGMPDSMAVHAPEDFFFMQSIEFTSGNKQHIDDLLNSFIKEFNYEETTIAYPAKNETYYKVKGSNDGHNTITISFKDVVLGGVKSPRYLLYLKF
jgi:hypothetical protein